MLWYYNGSKWQRAYMARKNLGLDAILCCPGPSLKNVPDLRGAHRKVFAINTAYPTVKPDIWLGMDKPNCYDGNLLFEGFPKILRGPYSKRTHLNQLLRNYPETYFADVKVPANEQTIFDLEGANTGFAWHKHTLGVALHFIAWMGAKDIYLVGCDLGGVGDYCHELRLKPEHREINRRLYAQQIVFLEEFAKQAGKHGITLHSSTQDSPINEFLSYTSIDALLAKYPQNSFTIHHVLDQE